MDIISNTRKMIPPQASQITPTYLTWSLLGLLLLAIITRISSSRNTRPRTIQTQDGQSAKTVARVPYWLPFLGHMPSLAWDAREFTKRLRDRYTDGIFALNLGGTVHYIISSPSLATALLNQNPANADSHTVDQQTLIKVFGLPTGESKVWGKALPEITACYKYLLSDPSLGKMVGETVRRLKENVTNLVSFTNSIVDQTLWERASSVKVTKNTKGEDVVEASLLPLVREMVAHSATPSIMGSNFLANFPDFFESIWTLDRAFLLLGMGLPRWLPLPLMTRAHIAQRKTFNQLILFHEAMEKEANGQDPGADWRDIDDVSTLVKERTKVYRKYGLSMTTRVGFEEALLWATNAKSNTLIFWMLNRIYADKDLLARIRKEIAPYASAVQPKQEFPVPEAPRWASFDVEGLCANCPLLKSCYLECLRLDTATWSQRVVQQDFVLEASEKRAQRWLLRKGEYADVAHELHNTDPNSFDDPMQWRVDRHVRKMDNEKTATADIGSLRPYGSGVGMCKGRDLALKECLAFTAAIVALWDVEPAGGGQWKMLKHRRSAGVYGPSGDTRVWLKRRELPRSA